MGASPGLHRGLRRTAPGMQKAERRMERRTSNIEHPTPGEERPVLDLPRSECRRKNAEATRLWKGGRPTQTRISRIGTDGPVRKRSCVGLGSSPWITFRLPRSKRCQRHLSVAFVCSRKAPGWRCGLYSLNQPGCGVLSSSDRFSSSNTAYQTEVAHSPCSHLFLTKSPSRLKPAFSSRRQAAVFRLSHQPATRCSFSPSKQKPSSASTASRAKLLRWKASFRPMLKVTMRRCGSVKIRLR